MLIAGSRKGNDECTAAKSLIWWEDLGIAVGNHYNYKVCF